MVIDYGCSHDDDSNSEIPDLYANSTRVLLLLLGLVLLWLLGLLIIHSRALSKSDRLWWLLIALFFSLQVDRVSPIITLRSKENKTTRPLTFAELPFSSLSASTGSDREKRRKARMIPSYKYAETETITANSFPHLVLLLPTRRTLSLLISWSSPPL